MTLEEAQAQILQLQEDLDAERKTNANYATQVESLTKDVTSLRELNQRYFLKLSAQYQPQAPASQEEEPDIPSCEDFAKTLDLSKF